MKQERRVRLALFGGSFAIVIIVSAFLWIINGSGDMKGLLILAGLSVLALAIFFFKAQIISHTGEIQSTMIITMMVGILILVQNSFAFMSYETRMSEFKFRVFNETLELVGTIDEADPVEYQRILGAAGTEDFEYIVICDESGKVFYTSNLAMYGKTVEKDDDNFSFALYSGQTLISKPSVAHQTELSKETIIGQLTLLVTSLLFSVEFVMFVIGKIGTVGIKRSDSDSPAILTSVRSVAFVFYFASRLCASFLPTLAKNLEYSGPALSQNFLAGLPQTAETMFVCISVLFTSKFLSKKGWKTPFISGVGLIFAGTLGCLLSRSLMPFVASRALVGLGYGFCWMTLRSIALLGKDEESRLMGFSMLNAGLYAGMYCGSTVGSILADRFGYGTVFIVSLCLIALCALNVFSMGNCYLPEEKKPEQDGNGRLHPKELAGILVFVVLMIAPSCILASYSGYFLPLFYDDLGRSVLDVGRVQLLYGLIIVYLGPAITRFTSRHIKKPLISNVLFVAIEVVGLIIVGVSGTMSASIICMVLIGIGDSFGFGVQNNYYMSLPANKRIGSGKSLMHLSLIKKLTEMLGPTAFAVAMGIPDSGIIGMGIIFAAFIGIYVVTELLRKTGKTR